MTCDRYAAWQTDRLDEVSFKRHMLECDSCQQATAQDARLVQLARELPRPDKAPRLWDRIEQTLSAETLSAETLSAGAPASRRRSVWIYGAAATLVVGLGLSAAWVTSDDTPAVTPNLYTSAALEKVRDSEREHLAAIEALSRVADARIERLDLELMVLYRDKIQTIDTQIARCLQALERNPANSHIHRYLFLALQDKKETLQEVLQLQL